MRFLNTSCKKHQLISIATENIQLKKYECIHCKETFTTDGYGKIVKLTPTLEKNLKIFTEYFKRRAAVI